MAKKTNSVLENEILRSAVEKINKYEERKAEKTKQSSKKIEELEKIIADTDKLMLRAATAGDSSAYVDEKKKHDAAVEQLDFMKGFIASREKTSVCTEEEADAFYSEIREGFHAVCADLDKDLITKLEAIRARLAEVEQLGMLLSDACEKFCRELDPKESRASLLFMGCYDFGTSDIGSILYEVYEHPEYVRLSGVAMRGTNFSDEKVRETEAISKELFNLR